MKKIITLLFSVFLFVNMYSQIDVQFSCLVEEPDQLLRSANVSNGLYNSSNGVGLPTHGVIRALTIFVNIIYDQNPDGDPVKTSNNI